MAETNPPQLVKIPCRVDDGANGAQIVSFPGLTDLVLTYTPLSTTAQENDSFSVGYFDEKWLHMQRSKLDDLESDLMHRMITVYYGLWPPYCAEHLMFKYVSSLFTKLEAMLLKRALFARRLFFIAGDPEHVREYETRFEELKTLNKSLPEPIYEFYENFEILEHLCQHPRFVGQHPEVVAFIADLEKHSNEFRESAWGERTEAMDECAREIEKKLKIR